jgi:hypothetical protein
LEKVKLFSAREYGKILLLALFFLLLPSSLPAHSSPYARVVSKKGIGIDQKLNAPIPLDLIFRDESDRPVPLRTYSAVSRWYWRWSTINVLVFAA